MFRGTARFSAFPLGLLLACALLLRTIIPVGWMPAAGHGLAIEICFDGGNEAASARFAEAARQRFELALRPTGQRDAGRAEDHRGADQTCAFAGLAMAWTGAETPRFTQRALAAAGPAPPAPEPIKVDGGLAAPPPPATGPPARA